MLHGFAHVKEQARQWINQYPKTVTILINNALSILTRKPPTMERNTRREIVALFSGQRTPMLPTQIPMLERLANPQREIAQIKPVLGSN